MDFDLQLPADGAFPNVGAVLVLLLIVRHPSTSSGCDIMIEIFMDPLLFLGCCAGFLQHLTQKTLLQSPLLQQKHRFGSSKEEIRLLEDSPKIIPAISIEKIGDEKDGESDKLISRAMAGLMVKEPELCSEGVNGTYFIRDVEGHIVAVFKPEDEELYSPNNPKTKLEENDRGILTGEAAAREVLASKINDRFEGFFAVPHTCMVKMTHPVFGNAEGKPVVKVGSLQEFVENDGSAGDVGPSMFPTDEVHRMAILDLILHNTDRHEGNILYRETSEGVKIIPIDHGFSLPDKVGGAWFDWINYPQAKKEFSGEILSVVERLSAETLSEEFTGVKLRPECRRTLDMSILLVKKGVKAGLTPRQLGLFASRRNPSEISQFEVLVSDAENMSGSFMENVSSLLEERLFALRV